MAQVLLEAVSREYPGGVRAVDGLNLAVAEREFLVLVGPSGCGKTTTLRLIAGLERPTAGTIRIAGRVVNGLPARERDVALVFQHQALFPHLSVYRNLAFGCQLRCGANWLRRGWWRMTNPTLASQRAAERAEIPARVRAAAAGVGLGQLLDRLPAELSGGERQRVALAKAILRQPAVFLFDEPLSDLDAKLRVEMRRELKQLQRQVAGTVIYVTHDQVEAMTLGDRIAVLDRGRLQQVGSPQEVYARSLNRFVAGFIGTPAMNFCPGRLLPSNAEYAPLLFAGEDWTVPVTAPVTAELLAYLERPLVLGIRPSDVHLQVGNGESPGEAAAIEAQVAVVESLGDTTIFHLSCGAAADAAPAAEARYLVCKASGDLRLCAGDRVRARLDMQRAHWFDAQTGANIVVREQAPPAERPAA